MALPAGATVDPQGLIFVTSRSSRNLSRTTAVQIRRTEQPGNLLDQRSLLTRRQGRRDSKRVGAQEEEKLGLVLVPNAGDKGLIEEEVGKRCSSSFREPAHSFGGVEVVGERVRSKTS